MLSTFESSKHPFDLFDRNFDSPHINAVTFVARKQSKSHNFSQEIFDMYLLLGLSSLFSRYSRAFFKKKFT